MDRLSVYGALQIDLCVEAVKFATSLEGNRTRCMCHTDNLWPFRVPLIELDYIPVELSSNCHPHLQACHDSNI
jgi:hypothetical protein